jgi:HlyD family secretion protein
MTADMTVTVDQITRRRKRRFVRGWMVWVMLAAGLAAGGYWYVVVRPAASPPAISYTTTPVGKGDITVVVTAVGTVEPIEQVEVGSLISGTIAQVPVAINDVVTKGTVLARLDTSSLEAELARDQASLAARKAEVEDMRAAQEAALATLARAQKMRDRGLNSEEDLSTTATLKRRAEAALASALANVQVAEADVKLSQTNIDKAVIVAPIDGLILDLAASVGQTVSASTNTVTLFTIAHDLGQMQLKVDVDEADIGQVSVGDTAMFSVDAYLGQSFPGAVTVMHYAPTKVDGIVTYPTILEIDNSDHLLRPGMTASADITVEHVADVLTVPNAAFRYAPPISKPTAARSSGLLGMLFSGGGPGRSNRQTTSVTNEVTKDGLRNLYVLRDGAAVQVAVKTGLTDGDQTQVISGDLSDMDQVITAQSSGGR